MKHLDPRPWSLPALLAVFCVYVVGLMLLPGDAASDWLRAAWTACACVSAAVVAEWSRRGQSRTPDGLHELPLVMRLLARWSVFIAVFPLLSLDSLSLAAGIGVLLVVGGLQYGLFTWLRAKHARTA